MKVLNINSYYFSSSIHEETKLRMDKYLNKFDVFAPVQKKSKLRVDIQGDFSIEPIKIHTKLDRIFYFRKQNKSMKYLKKHYNIPEYDVIHAHSLFSNGYLAMKLSTDYSLPYVVTVRATDIDFFFKYFLHLRSVGKKILKKADKIIFISPSARDAVLNLWRTESIKTLIKDKSIVIPNGVNSFWLENIYTDKKNVENVVRFVYVGAINNRKNLISVCKTLKSINLETSLTVVGKIENQKVFDKAKKIFDFEYKGVLTREQLIEEYRTASILIVPSISETFGLVYVEAMTQGVPVIYSQNQGFDGFFQNGVIGYAVDPNETKSIEEGIYKILETYDFMSKQCIKLCKKFDWDNISKEYIQIYNNVIHL